MEPNGGHGKILNPAFEIAVEVACSAGTLIRGCFGGSFRAKEKGDFGDLVTEVDEQAEKEIIFRIRRHFPDHAIRGRKRADRGKRETGCGWSIPWTGRTISSLACPSTP